jgi:hypothetical protein
VCLTTLLTWILWEPTLYFTRLASALPCGRWVPCSDRRHGDSLPQPNSAKHSFSASLDRVKACFFGLDYNPILVQEDPVALKAVRVAGRFGANPKVSSPLLHEILPKTRPHIQARHEETRTREPQLAVSKEAPAAAKGCKSSTYHVDDDSMEQNTRGNEVFWNYPIGEGLRRKDVDLPDAHQIGLIEPGSTHTIFPAYFYSTTTIDIAKGAFPFLPQRPVLSTANKIARLLPLKGRKIAAVSKIAITTTLKANVLTTSLADSPYIQSQPIAITCVNDPDMHEMTEFDMKVPDGFIYAFQAVEPK